MHPRKFALIGGILMLVWGLAALIPTLSSIPADGLPALTVNSSYGFFLGFIPMNIVNKFLLIVVGLLGIAASRAPATSLPKSIAWSRLVFALMGIFAVLGMIPQTTTLFGYAPLYGHYRWIHGLVSLIAAYYSFALPARAEKPTPENLRKRQAVAGM